jgi:quercetin dioxygenase-like cupin family protein
MNDQPSTPIVPLGTAVEYSPHSIVSRVILKKTNGQVTLFAFDAGEELSEHTTPYDAIISVTDGTADVTIGGTPYRVNSGEAIILPANIPHAVKAADKFKMMLTMIK